MINPFTRMNEKFIPAFRQRGKRYLVMQEFKGENNLFKDPAKKYVLVSHYENPAEAMHQYKVVKEEPVSKLIDLDNEDDRKEFESIMNINSGFVVYSILVANPAATKRAVDKQLKYKIQNYIASNTQWHIGKEQSIVPELETTFGELFVILKYSAQKIRVALKELESF